MGVTLELGVSQGCIWNVWRRFHDTHNYARRPGTGVQRVTVAGDDRYLRFIARGNPFISARRIRNEFQHATGITVSAQTVRNRLHDNGLHARKPRVVPRMTDDHSRLRLEWARQHVIWNINQ